MAPRLVERADGFIDLFPANGTAGFESVGGCELAAGSLLGGDQVAKEDVPVCEGFLNDESIGGVVVEGIAKGGGFGGALGGVVVACGLDDLAKLAVGACKAWMCLLDVHLTEFDAEI